MDNPMFTKVIDDIYIRQYDLAPELFGGQTVRVYAECRPNKEKVNGHEYWLDVYLSVDGYGDRDFLEGVSFGDAKLEKKSLDMQINGWVVSLTEEPTFMQDVEAFLKKEELYEKWTEEEMLKDSDS